MVDFINVAILMMRVIFFIYFKHVLGPNVGSDFRKSKSQENLEFKNHPVSDSLDT